MLKKLELWPIKSNPLYLKTVEKKGPISTPKEKVKKKTEKQRGIFCAHCLNYITSFEDKITVEGKHLHHFFNPQGIVFEIGCFAKAPGCLGVGPFTQEFTWFYPYSWQICICSKCKEHLGWLYVYQTDFFYGLIVGRLLEK